MQVVQTMQFKTFKEFWETISPVGMMGEKLSGFIYRGEDSNQYELLPVALRSDKGNKENLWTWGDDVDTEYLQVKYERFLLAEFYKEANVRGLRVPNNKIFLSRQEHNYLPFHFLWLSDDFEETAALVQHYGIPTRLLDWTQDIFVAFYFASIGVINKMKERNNSKETTDTFVIYALNYGFLIEQTRSWYSRFKDCTNYKPMPLKFVVPRYSDNPNSAAQCGILTYTESHIDYTFSENDKMDRLPLDQRLQSIEDSNGLHTPYTFSDHTILLYRFEIPVIEALNMFNFISQLNYSYSRLFPGYNGITNAIKENDLVCSANRRSKLDA
jgi:hypothetical protein